MSRFKNLSSPVKCLIFFLILGILFTTGEFSIRIYARSHWKRAIRIGDLCRLDDSLGYRLKENYDGGSFKINSKGIVGPEYTIDKKTSYRIIVLGDSCSFTPQPDSWPFELEKSLNEAGEDKTLKSKVWSFEVINGSVSGYTSLQCAEWYTTELSDYQHEATLIMLGWNDMWSYNPFTPRYTEFKQNRKYKQRFTDKISSLYTVRAIISVLRMYASKGKSYDRELTPDQVSRFKDFSPSYYEESLREIIKKARESGSQPFLVERPAILNDHMTSDEINRCHFPFKVPHNVEILKKLDLIYNNAMEKVAQEEKVEILRTRQLFTTDAERKHFNDTCHFDSDASSRIGKEVADELIQKMGWNK